MVPGLLIAVSLSWGSAREANDRWFAIDKTKHFFTAAMVQSVSFTALRTAGASKSHSLAGATVVAGAASIGKELMDLRRAGTLSAKDLVWDAAGMAAAGAVLHRTR